MRWPRIPRWAMPSQALVREPVESEDGGEFAPLGEARTISHVRFESARELARKRYVLSDGAKGLLFVDAANSGGAYGIPVGSLVQVDGREWLSASKVTPLSIDGPVHHWEVELS